MDWYVWIQRLTTEELRDCGCWIRGWLGVEPFVSGAEVFCFVTAIVVMHHIWSSAAALFLSSNRQLIIFFGWWTWPSFIPEEGTPVEMQLLFCGAITASVPFRFKWLVIFALPGWWSPLHTCTTVHIPMHLILILQKTEMMDAFF